MAPEQMGTTGVDARADIWSLGVVLYELCTGESPFFGETIPAICARVIGIDPAPPTAIVPELPAGLEAVILRCLQKKPELRPGDIAELAAELAAFGSADAAEYANSARLVLGARTNPALAPRQSLPIGLSATLAVLGQGLGTPRPRRFQPRVGLVGAALAGAVVLGGAFTFRSGQAHEASMLAAPTSTAPAVAPTFVAAAPVAPSTPSLPHASIVLPQPSAKPSLTRSPGSDLTSNTALKRAVKGTHSAWDPKSFGGRL
jgi:serine/threonine-protein kinase